MTEPPETATTKRTAPLSAQAERVLGRAAKRARSNDAASHALIGCGLALLAINESYQRDPCALAHIGSWSSSACLRCGHPLTTDPEGAAP